MTNKSSASYYGLAVLATVAVLFQQVSLVSGQDCLADPELNAVFATDEPTCCQNDVCALPCPEPVSAPTKGTSCPVLSSTSGRNHLFGSATLGNPLFISSLLKQTLFFYPSLYLPS